MHYLTSWDMGCLFVSTCEMCSVCQNTLLKETWWYKDTSTSNALTHLCVARICIISIDVNTGLPSLVFAWIVDAVGSRKKATFGLVRGQKFMAHNGSQCAATAPTSPGEFHAFWSSIVSIFMPEILPFSRTMSLVHLV